MAHALPILMYHRIRSERCRVPGNDPDEVRYSVDLEAFEWQMDLLVSLGRRGVSLGPVFDDLAARVVSGNDVVLTFDDGNRSDFEHAMPILADRGFSATFFICGNRINVDGGLDEAMLRELCGSGMEMGAHGMTHRFLSTLGEADQRMECGDSKKALSQITGKPTRFFAPPGGRYNKLTVDILRELSYEAVCTSRFGYNGSATDPFALKRIPVTLATSRAAFEGVINRSPRVMLPAQLRATTLDVARKLLGEGSYGRLRSLLFRE